MTIHTAFNVIYTNDYRLDCWHAWNFKGLPLDQVDLIWNIHGE